MTEVADAAQSDVALYGGRIGRLERRNESSRFTPSTEWADQAAGRRPVLGQIFENDPFAAHASRYGAPRWFEHLLPERGGPLREAIARSLGIAEARSYLLLVALGRDLPGAVRVSPREAGADAEDPGHLVRREQHESDPSTSLSGMTDIPMRVSLAGLQFKLSARVGDRGVALPADGEDGDWIIKFADQRFPTLPMNEFITMEWARASGLNVPEVRIVKTDAVEGLAYIAPIVGDQAFAIKRYDRRDGERLHQEDFAQVLDLAPGEEKYTATNHESIARVISALAPVDIPELIRRFAFCFVCGNDDAHAKNWSLWYPEKSAPRLSPAYDLVTTVEYFAKGELALKFGGVRRFSDITLRAVERFAKRSSLDGETVEGLVVHAVREQVTAWTRVRLNSPVNDDFRRLVDARLEALPLIRECR